MAGHRRACAACGTAERRGCPVLRRLRRALGRACGTCGVEANATARFCRACGERRSTIGWGTNCANDVTSHLFWACNARDIDAAVAAYGDPFVYDDRRRLSGDPIDDQAGLRAAIGPICEQYSALEAHTLAVRRRAAAARPKPKV